jgi:Tol biopolymer transport system component
VAAIAVAVAVVVGGIWLQRQPKAALKATNFQLLSSFPGSHRWPTFSPDGSMIAFVSDAGGSPQIWVKNLAGGDPIRITSGKLNPSHPSWSPRNDQIIFQAGEELTSQSIWSVPPLGGSPRRILEGAFAPSFSRKGSRIAFRRFVAGPFTCNADGSDIQLVSGGPNTLGFSVDDGPVYSPDGRTLAVFLAGPRGLPELQLAPTRAGQWTRLLAERFEATHPVWTPDGDAIIFSSPRGGARNLWLIPASGGTLAPITTGTGDDDEPAISRDGRRLAYTNTRGTYALMVLDTATGSSRQVLEQRSEIVDARQSPSGDKLALEVTVKDENRLYVVGSDGTGMRSIGAEGDSSGYMPQWSRDGTEIYFFRSRPKVSFRRVSLAGGPSGELAPKWGSEISPTWQVAPDGKRVAYSVLQDGKAVAAMVLDLATGAKTALPVALLLPRWSHDGSLLVGSRQQFSNQVFVCTPSGSPCTAIQVRNGAGPPFWSPDDTRIFFPVWKGFSPDRVEVWRVNRDGTDEALVAELTSVAKPEEFVSEGSSTGMMPWVQYRPGRREIWLAELKR